MLKRVIVGLILATALVASAGRGSASPTAAWEATNSPAIAPRRPTGCGLAARRRLSEAREGRQEANRNQFHNRWSVQLSCGSQSWSGC